MNNYELLLSKISGELPVIELPLNEHGVEGNYYNGMIFIDSSLPSNRKREILSEEYGHFKTSSGIIINYNHAESRKQELVARKYSIEMIVTLDDLIECYENKLTTAYECAEYLDISIDLFQDALSHYLSKYGTNHTYKDKVFVFSDESVKIFEKK